MRHCATSLSDLDSEQTGRDEAARKLLLKEIFACNRRSDSLRMPEFDMLRKISKREAMLEQSPGRVMAYFQDKRVRYAV